VGKLLILGVIREEDVSRGRCRQRPHGRPQVAGPQPEEQIEDTSIKLRVEGVAELVFVLGPPFVKGWLLVVDAQSSILDARFSLDKSLRKGTNMVVFLGRDIGPRVIPIAVC
jgi:hypothetical protein